MSKFIQIAAAASATPETGEPDMEKFADYLIPYVAPLTRGLILVCSRGPTEDEPSSYSYASSFGGNLLASAIYEKSGVRHFWIPRQWTKDRAAGEKYAKTILDIAEEMPTIMPCHSDAIKIGSPRWRILCWKLRSIPTLQP